MKLLLLSFCALALYGQTTTQCTSYTLSAGGVLSDATATTAANPASFTVTTQANCPFVVTTAATWLHILSPAAGTTSAGTSKVLFTIDANPTAQQRTDQILVYPGSQIVSGSQSLPFTVIQVAGICNYTLSPTSVNLPVSGGSGSLTVSTGCNWSAAATPFINASIPNSTGIPNMINYQVPANPCLAPRTGVISLVTGAPNPPSAQITQAGSPDNFTLSTTNVTDPSTALANQKVAVTTGSSCPWGSYTDSANWLHLNSGSSGTGNGTLVYSTDANQGAQRTGHIFFQSGVDSQGNPLPAGTLTIVQQAVTQATPVLTAIVNDGSFDLGKPAPAPISPGEIVALFGVNLGPVTGVLNSQTYGTSLGGVQVLFGSTAAPLIYASATQVNAVVPYSLTGTSVAVTVQFNNVSSAPVTVPLQPTTPGIFSYDSTGTGPGAILNNADFSVNAAARAAAAGTVVDIYCTGGGVTTPVSKDGALATSAPPFPTLNAQDVSVTIGGVPAKVVYAGPAPGLINGLTQVDAIVPDGLTPGSLPIVVTIGGVSSQANLSVAVR